MNKRTFILSLSEKDKENFEDDDIVNTIMLRIAEVYLDINEKADIGIEFLSIIKNLIQEKITKDKNSFTYFVDIDFEKEVVK
jgi:hypothetical protein